MAIVLGDNGIGNRETEPAAMFLRGKIGIEDIGTHMGRDANAVIRHGELNITPGIKPGDGLGIEHRIVGPNRHDAAIGHGLGCVEHDIADHLMHLAGIHMGRPQVGGNVQLRPNHGPVQGKIDGLADQRGD